MHLRIGTRGSALALAQATWVQKALQAAGPEATSEIVVITTRGDRSQNLAGPGPGWGEGVFARELEAALRASEIDLAVHSLKDLPPAMDEDMALVAVPERESPFDVLVSREGGDLKGLAEGATVGTSSARRVAFLRSVRPDLNLVLIRGNVDTRLRKLLDGEVDALVLAQAGLNRLALNPPMSVLDPTQLPPAPAQGALGLEARATEAWIEELTRSIDHAPSQAAVTAERALMRRLGAGCQLPVGCLATIGHSGSMTLVAAVASADGRRIARCQQSGHSDDPIELALGAAELLLAAGAAELALTWTGASGAQE